MGQLRFGTREDLHCIVDVTATINGESLCLAYKTSTYWLGAGVYVKDDGYVLKPRDRQGIYYELPAEARAGQMEGVPSPLPAYSLGFGEYFAGYSLWWALAFLAVWLLAVRAWRRFRQRRFDETVAQAPLDHGPPRLDTEGDRFVYDTVQPHLVPGEKVQHQAYALSWNFDGDAPDHQQACFVVLTTARLFVWQTRVGAFRILYERGPMTMAPRSDVSSAVVAHGDVLFVTANGEQRGYVIRPQKGLSNQQAFLLNAGRLLSAPAPSAVGHAPPRAFVA